MIRHAVQNVHAAHKLKNSGNPQYAYYMQSRQQHAHLHYKPLSDLNFARYTIITHSMMAVTCPLLLWSLAIYKPLIILSVILINAVVRNTA